MMPEGERLEEARDMFWKSVGILGTTDGGKVRVLQQLYSSRDGVLRPHENHRIVRVFPKEQSGQWDNLDDGPQA